jgi:hypothetical protein
VLTDWFADPIATGVYGGVCVRQIDQYASGFCLLVGVGLNGSNTAGWVLQAGPMGMKRTPGTILASGQDAAMDLAKYHSVSLTVQGQKLVAAVDGKTVASVSNTDAAIPPVGQAALRSSYSYTQFDDLLIDAPEGDAPALGTAMSAYPDAVFAKHLLWPPKAAPGGPQDPAHALVYTSGGWYGCAFTVGDQPLTVWARPGRLSALSVLHSKSCL